MILWTIVHKKHYLLFLIFHEYYFIFEPGLVILYYWPWPTFKKSNIWNVSITKTVIASTQKCNMSFVDIDFFAIEWRQCEINTVLLLIYFFKANISNFNISDTVRPSARTNTTFIDFDIHHRMTQLRKLYSMT